MTVRDQNGALWNVVSGVPRLVSASPSPRFGPYCLGAVPDTGLLIMVRDPAHIDATPTNVADCSVLLDSWMFCAPDIFATHTTTMGRNVGPVNLALEIDLFNGVWVTANYVKSDQPKIRAVAPWLPAYNNQWVNTRALLNNDGVNLFVNGNLVAHAAVANAVATVFPISSVVMGLNSNMYIDEFKSLHTQNLSVQNYTPRSTPWPNP